MPNPGLSPEIQEAIKRRQGGQAPTPALNQVSPGAANASQMPAPMPQAQMSSPGIDSQPPKMPRLEPQDRIDLITVALVEQMKNDAKLEKEKGKMARGETQKPPAPAPQAPTAPQGAPMGGGSPFSMSPGFQQPMPVNQMQGNYAGGMGNYGGMNNYGK